MTQHAFVPSCARPATDFGGMQCPLNIPKMQICKHTCHPFRLGCLKLQSRPRTVHNRQCRERRHRHVAASGNLVIFDPDDIVLETSLGTVGFMTVSSYTPDTDRGGLLMGSSSLDLDRIQQQGTQSLSSGNIKVRLYTGRVKRGMCGGTRVLLKAYPRGAGSEADAMAANELVAHSSLKADGDGQHVCSLLGGFSPERGPTAGEQWLVFRNDGTTTAAQYAQAAAQGGRGGGGLLGMLQPDRLQQRQAFVQRLLRQTLTGLAYMHARFRLHQSIGPQSVLLSSTDESGGRPLVARLWDLAFSVDVCDAALFGGATLADIWERRRIEDEKDPLKQLAAGLWARAERAGAQTQLERRNFGIADDVYAAGLLLAYMAFVPFCEPGSIDAPSLQRLLETTFQLDIEGARDFCEADERWTGAVAFLDAQDGAGWGLLAAMLNTDWRRRPTAESCLNHPFLKAAIVSDA